MIGRVLGNYLKCRNISIITNLYYLPSTSVLSTAGNLQKSIVRNVGTRKRFYRKTGIVHSSGRYEVTLDQKKLKTPKGNILTVNHEPLALAIAAEWDSQKDKIIQSSMHLTILCNTSIDNPNNLTKVDMANYIMNYMETDAILCHSGENDELYKFQQTEWDPVIEWFCNRFDIDVQKTRELGSPPYIPEAAKAVIGRYITSHNFASVCGFIYGIDALKSVILMCACAERYLSAEKASVLSRLEEEFQLGHWGRVEWAHDLNQHDLQARLSAAIMFIYFNSSTSSESKKVLIRNS